MNIKQYILQFIEKAGFTIIKTKYLRAKEKLFTLTREDFFNLYFSQVNPESFFFVEIGASDGVSGDPFRSHIIKNKLRGILVEPVPETFKKLQNNYSGYPVTCVQAAISDSSEVLPFYSLNEQGQKEASKLPITSKGNNEALLMAVSSLDRDHFKSHLQHYLKRTQVDGFISQNNVQVLSFNDLVIKYNIQNIDALLIDAEGHDWKILQTIDFTQFKPRLINIETASLFPEDYAACLEFLTSKGYKTFRNKNDTVAYQV